MLFCTADLHHIVTFAAANAIDLISESVKKYKNGIMEKSAFLGMQLGLLANALGKNPFPAELFYAT